MIVTSLYYIKHNWNDGEKCQKSNILCWATNGICYLLSLRLAVSGQSTLIMPHSNVCINSLSALLRWNWAVTETQKNNFKVIQNAYLFQKMSMYLKTSHVSKHSVVQVLKSTCSIQDGKPGDWATIPASNHPCRKFCVKVWGKPFLLDF